MLFLDPLDEESQKLFIRTYLENYNNVKNLAPPTEEDISKLNSRIGVFSLASLLYWGSWGIFQTFYSKLNFDFAKFVQNRFTYYNNLKAELFKNME